MVIQKNHSRDFAEALLFLPMTENLQKIAQHLEKEVELSLNTLQNRLATVERELDLECLNLRDIVNSQDPAINHQLDALSGSIKDLHASLAEVKGHLEKALDGGRELEAAMPTEPKTQETKTGNPVARGKLTAEEESRLRHDEAITLSGIFRALFMADEPAQRAESTKKGSF